MAIVSSDFLAGVLTNFSRGFNDAFDAADNILPWRDLVQTVQSNTDTETHAWLGAVPKMIDTTKKDLEVDGLTSYNYTIQNKTWKAGFEVQRTTFEDDKLNLIRPKISQLGTEAARHPGELVLTLSKDNGLAYDGVAFFADTRALGLSGNIDNSMAGGGVTTVALIQADLATARGTMRRFKDDQGRAMNAVPNVIMVPPELEQIMWQALNANQGNINQPVVPATQNGVASASGFTVVTNPFLTDVNDWFVFSVTPATRPFVFQERLAPALEGVTDPNTSGGVIRDRFIYSARARYNVGYGDPRYAVRITN